MTRHLDIDLLRTFVAIAETHTLGRAGGRVGRTQAAVSMQVKKLEAMLNQPLLNRTGRGVQLTLHGERLLAHARTILRHHDAAVADISGAGLSGTLRFGCPDDYATAFLPHILRSFAGRHPQVFVEVLCAPTPRLRERLKRHELDLALVSTAQNDPTSVVRREPLVWVGKHDDDAVLREPLQLALSDPDTLDHRAACEGLDATGRAYRVAYASGSISGLLAVVRSGQAIAVLTQAAVPADLQVLPTGNKLLPRLPDVGLAVAFDLRRPPPLAVEFAEHLQRQLPAL